MLEVSLYGSSWELSQNIELQKINSIILVPSPQIADGLRETLTSDVEILTISKWASNWLKQKKLSRTNKSQLMLMLCSVWRNYFPSGEINLFLRAFEIFTEMRSFSLQLEILSDFIKELEPDLSKSIYIFWAFLQNENVIDEQMSYKICSEFSENNPLHLIGFRHMSGVQIDMLKEISQNCQVTIYVPREVYADTVEGDWIRWLTSAPLPLKEVETKTVDVLYFPGNRLNSTIAQLNKKESHFDICLTQKAPSFHSIQEVISPKIFYKTPVGLFQSSIELAKTELNELVENELKNLEEILEFVEKQKEKALTSEQYLLYKVWCLFQNAIITYQEFQSGVDIFALKIISEIVQLNAPRVFYVALDSTYESRIVQLEDLPFYSFKNKIIIVGSSLYGSLKGSEEHKTDKMISALRAIGPLKRAGLDFSFVKSDIKNALRSHNSLLVLEEGIDHVDLAWKEILLGFNIRKIEAVSDVVIKKNENLLRPKKNILQQDSKNLSASKLQAYIDCPRKYYYSYIEKIEHRPDARIRLSADEKGILEHKIIEEYFKKLPIKQTKQLNTQVISQCVSEVLDVFLERSEIILTQKQQVIEQFEIFTSAQNGISYLLNYIIENPAHDIKFEEPIVANSFSLVGYIDCVVYLENSKIGLFDFKRSSSAIGTRKETLAYEKIQLWVYLLSKTKWNQYSIHQTGYLNLSDLSESLIFKETDKKAIGPLEIDLFENYIDKKIKSLREESLFCAQPRKTTVCSFCELKLYCDKGGG